MKIASASLASAWSSATDTNDPLSGEAITQQSGAQVPGITQFHLLVWHTATEAGFSPGASTGTRTYRPRLEGQDRRGVAREVWQVSDWTVAHWLTRAATRACQGSEAIGIRLSEVRAGCRFGWPLKHIPEKFRVTAA